MTVIHFTQRKKLNIERFSQYLTEAQTSNQFTNYGYAVKTLEQRARKNLQIPDSKAIIATCNGAAALNAIMAAIHTSEPVYSQDFTFPCNFQIPGVYTEPFDLDDAGNPDIYHIRTPGILIITNCFGHVVDIDKILKHAELYNQKVVFDNAASPYSFYKGKNISAYGIASYISLHHTKPLGFGEGGLVIIDKSYETSVRAAINFGMHEGRPVIEGNNYKMSELSAAGILQWWDSFDIDELRDNYLKAYNKYENKVKIAIPNYSDSFFPNCLPVIENNVRNEIMDIRKYYRPIIGLRNSIYLYERISCLPITEFTHV